MEKEKIFPIKEKDIEVTDFQKEGIDFIFTQNPELIKIGTPKEYNEYIETIFPESVTPDIFFHGTNELDAQSMKKEGFVARKSSLREDLPHYGFYFGDKYSHYQGGNNKNYTVPVVLNIKKPLLLATSFNINKYHRLSALDTTVPTQDFYELGDKDAVYQTDFEPKFGKDISTEERKKIRSEFETKLMERMSPEDLVSIQNLHKEIEDLSNLYITNWSEIYNQPYPYIFSIKNLLDTHKEELLQSDRKDLGKIESQINLLKEISTKQDQFTDTLLKYFTDIKGRISNLPATELMVLNPDQIHVLGSQSDLDGFKKFIESSQNKLEKSVDKITYPKDISQAEEIQKLRSDILSLHNPT